MSQRSLSTLLFLVFLSIQGFSQSLDKVRFTGRFDFSGEVPTFSHVSSSISANFQGSAISATFSASYGVSYLYVILDENDDPLDRKVIVIESSTVQEFILAKNLQEGEHRIEVVKLNQYDTKLGFHGFSVEDGLLLEKPEEPIFSMEFYGDSHPAGNSAWDEKDWGKAADNGGYYTYPGITARLLGAQYHNVSMGGAGVTSGTWNLRDYHHLIHMNEAASGDNLWNFSIYTTDVVVVNLGANDYYAGKSKWVIKNGWKDFVREDLRKHYPEAHIVLLNSRGWAIDEPADYVHEAVEELKAEGEENVTSITIPWLWGQQHAVVNEHAGFANMLAQHIALEMNLPKPDSTELSSFAPYGEISNGSFEKSTLPGVADGWRPHGPVALISDSAEAYHGGRCLELGDGAWVNIANEAGASETYTVSGWLRGMNEGAEGALKIEFKDQEQKTISFAEERRELTGEWEYFSVSLRTPRTVWSLWVVLDKGQNNRVRYDQIELRLGEKTSLPEPEPSTSSFSIFPNPTSDDLIYLKNPDHLFARWLICDARGRTLMSGKLNGEPHQGISFPRRLDPGLYLLTLDVAGHAPETLKILLK